MNRMNGRSPAVDGQAPRAWLPPRAAVFFFFLLSGTVVVLAPLLSRLSSGRDEPWATFAILAVLAGVAHLLVVVTPKNEGYAIDIVFVIAAVLLLPPELAVLVAVAQFIPDWLRERRPWYIQIFNTCDSMLSILAGTKFFGEGHKWSGLDPERLGARTASYAGRGRVTIAAQRAAAQGSQS